MSHVMALSSWMWTFGSIAMPMRSLAESPCAEPAATPVVRKADLVQDLAADAQWSHPFGDQDPCLDRGA